MGHRPHAVLAYGYDLTESMFDYDSPTPDWFDDEDASWRDNAVRALLAAKDIVIAPGEYFDPAKLFEQTGVELVALENDGDAQGILLAAKVHETDWDDNLVIPHFVLPDDADERLHWAMGVLGIDSGVLVPEWILASYYG